MILTFPNDLEPQKKPAEHALAHKVYGNDSCEKEIKIFIVCLKVARKYLNRCVNSLDYYVFCTLIFALVFAQQNRVI